MDENEPKLSAEKAENVVGDSTPKTESLPAVQDPNNVESVLDSTITTDADRREGATVESAPVTNMEIQVKELTDELDKRLRGGDFSNVTDHIDEVEFGGAIEKFKIGYLRYASRKLDQRAGELRTPMMEGYQTEINLKGDASTVEIARQTASYHARLEARFEQAKAWADRAKECREEVRKLRESK